MADWTFMQIRAAVQHLAIFVPWQFFVEESVGDINEIWERHKLRLSKRVSTLVDNIQLLRRSAEDVKSDARQWAASSGEFYTAYTATDRIEQGITGGDESHRTSYRSDSIGIVARLADVMRNAIAGKQITANSPEISGMLARLLQFQGNALVAEEEANDTIFPEQRKVGVSIPNQDQVRSIKSQQASASRERERMIQGIQGLVNGDRSIQGRPSQNVPDGFGDEDSHAAIVGSDPLVGATEPSVNVQFG